MNLITRRTVFSRLLDPGAGEAIRRQCLAGAVAGFLAFHLETPVGRLLGAGAPGSEENPTYLAFGAVMVAALSGVLTAAEDHRSGSASRLARRFALATVAGTLLGLVAGVLLSWTLLLAPWSFPPVVPAGPLTGGLTGAALGLLSRSSRRVAAAAGGGALGGLLGALLAIAVGALLGALPAIVVLGTVTALGISIADQLARSCWIAFVSEPREGEIVPVYRSVAWIGRSDSADIPLFGDRSIAPQHAILTLSPTPVIREVSPVGLLQVNGEPARQAALWDGVLVEIGKHCFRFRHPRFPGGAAGAPSPLAAHVQQILESETTVVGLPPSLSRPQLEGALAQPVPDPEDRTIAMPPVTSLALRVEQSLIPLGGVVTIGREEDNRIRLADAKVSRHHARIEARRGAWVLRDLGSRNGTRVNGVRVVRSGLLPGDVIAVGDTLLIVEAV